MKALLFILMIALDVCALPADLPKIAERYDFTLKDFDPSAVKAAKESVRFIIYMGVSDGRVVYGTKSPSWWSRVTNFENTHVKLPLSKIDIVQSRRQGAVILADEASHAVSITKDQLRPILQKAAALHGFDLAKSEMRFRIDMIVDDNTERPIGYAWIGYFGEENPSSIIKPMDQSFKNQTVNFYTTYIPQVKREDTSPTVTIEYKVTESR